MGTGSNYFSNDYSIFKDKILQVDFLSTAFQNIKFYLLLGFALLVSNTSVFAQETVTDIDGNVYETVVIGNQRWIKSNLRVKHYRNGDPILQIQDPIAWVNTRQGAWCYLNNDPSTEEEYGLLYNAFAFMDPRRLVPEGTFLPSACDWGDLYFELEGTPGQSINDNNFMGDKVKVTSFFNPNFGDSQPTNSSGLSIVPSGFRSGRVTGQFTENAANFWTNTIHFEIDNFPAYWVSTFVSEWKWWRPVSGYTVNYGLSIRLLVGEELPKTLIRQEEQVFCGKTTANELQFSATKPNSFGCAGPGNLTLNCYKSNFWYRDIDLTIPVNLNEELNDGEILFGRADHLFLNSFPLTGLCQEEILEVTVRILDPDPPVGEENQVFCAGATVADLQATGDEIRWYQTMTSTTPLDPGTVLQNNRSYFAENRSGDCVNPTRFQVQVELVSPSQPTAAATQEVCEGTLLSALTVQGTDLVWFDAGGGELPASTPVMDGITYFVASKVADCESARTPVRVLFSGPATPPATATQEFCPGARVADLTATGQNIRWYAVASGGNPLEATIALEDGRTYYATQTIDGCESRQRREVSVSLASVGRITAAATQTFCNTARVSNLEATGTGIRWYADESLTTQLTPDSPLENGRTYYGTQTINGCESPSLAVRVTISTVETPTGATTQGFCTGARISELIAQGNNIRWFTTATGGSALSGTELLENRVYYAEQTVNGCVSAERLAVQVTVSTIDTPAATASQQFCVGATIASIQVSGENIRWFASPTDNVPLSASEALVDGRTYYASQTVNGCESTGRRAVQIRVINVAPVTAAASQSFCNAATVSNLQATGSDIRWYADQNLTTELSSNSPLENGRTYYATQSQNGCESVPVAVQVTIDSVTAPSGNAEQEFCEGVFVDDLQASGSDVQWFTTPSGGSPLAGNLPLQDGVTYFAEQTVGTCTSATRLAVRVRINSPQLPAASSQQEFCDGSLVSALQATGTNLVWYRNATGPELLNLNEPIQDGALYYVSQRIGSCESARREIRASIIQVQAPVVQESEQIFCESEAPTISRLSASGEQIRWYSMEAGGQPLSETERLQDGQTYYAANVSRGCESADRVPVRVLVQPCDVEVFNMVTRNRDPKNNYLKIKNIEFFPENRLEIFNRYGVLVWASDAYGQLDNLFYGATNQAGVGDTEMGLPTGNYLYVLTYEIPGKFTTQRKTGYLYLINEMRK
ncbi:Ig-like domain-containing protein [Mongoliitalea daihaiensis]|uniref:Ig-like domain-containing protein n=1 Tax=Mongoliitalea daihaiensis TaxID=2782006 RepID=UPI001F454945|nr:FISUMP domain-containing protein [Mongoliitalea daihaiensis]UJP64392.1 gliding motility-associated C-terminal domain-containing protein [Mongoliitalea daihaiensis]